MSFRLVICSSNYVCKSERARAVFWRSAHSSWFERGARSHTALYKIQKKKKKKKTRVRIYRLVEVLHTLRVCVCRRRWVCYTLDSRRSGHERNDRKGFRRSYQDINGCNGVKSVPATTHTHRSWWKVQYSKERADFTAFGHKNNWREYRWGERERGRTREGYHPIYLDLNG